MGNEKGVTEMKGSVRTWGGRGSDSGKQAQLFRYSQVIDLGVRGA